jgi:hypothetical protein
MPRKVRSRFGKTPDFDVLSNDPLYTAEMVKENLNNANIENVRIVKHEPIGEIVPIHYEVIVGVDTVLFIYKPMGCHSYNRVDVGGKTVRVATIDTMLSFYLAFVYINREYYDPYRILCMSTFLFDVQQKNRLQQKGVLRRFSITCYGHEPSLEEIKALKSKKYEELKSRKNSTEYQEYFLSYMPKTKTNTKTKRMKNGDDDKDEDGDKNGDKNGNREKQTKTKTKTVKRGRVRVRNGTKKRGKPLSKLVAKIFSRKLRKK